ncbi:MAG: hypothetical protein ABL904_11085 [Hyphomicrobiaceae bacterium]
MNSHEVGWQLDALKREYRQVYGELLSVLPYTGSTDQADILVSWTEEVGAERAASALRRHPERASVPSNEVERVLGYLTRLDALTAQIDGVMAERNRLLQADDPNYRPVIVIQGEDARIGEPGFEPRPAPQRQDFPDQPEDIRRRRTRGR